MSAQHWKIKTPRQPKHDRFGFCLAPFVILFDRMNEIYFSVFSNIHHLWYYDKMDLLRKLEVVKVGGTFEAISKGTSKN
jgi:hypothetical protein